MYAIENGARKVSPGENVFCGVVDATLRQEKVFDVIPILADLFHLLQARDARLDNAVQQSSGVSIALKPQKKEALPVDAMDRASDHLLEPVDGVPILEVAATIVSPQKRFLGDAM